MDATRPTTMAHVFMLETDSPGYNRYFSWYLGELEQNDAFFDDYCKKYPERIIGFSEYGAEYDPGWLRLRVQEPAGTQIRVQLRRFSDTRRRGSMRRRGVRHSVESV